MLLVLFRNLWAVEQLLFNECAHIFEDQTGHGHSMPKRIEAQLHINLRTPQRGLPENAGWATQKWPAKSDGTQPSSLCRHRGRHSAIVGISVGAVEIDASRLEINIIRLSFNIELNKHRV